MTEPRYLCVYVLCLFYLLSSRTIFYELFWRQSLVVCMAVRCLTLSSFVFFYSLWTLLKTDFCCPVWQSVVLLWVLLCSFIRCELFWRQSFVAVCCLTLSSSMCSFVFFYYASFAAWVSFFRQAFSFRGPYFSSRILLHAIPNSRFRHTVPWIWGGMLEIYIGPWGPNQV